MIMSMPRKSQNGDVIVILLLAVLRKNAIFLTGEKKTAPFLDWIATGNTVTTTFAGVKAQ